MRFSSVEPATFRSPRNLALARLSELAAPFLKIAAGAVVRSKPAPPASWRRGILLGADHIGDVLYNTASLPFLAEALPECEWHFIAAPSTAAVLANNPFIKSCTAAPEKLGPIDVAICYNSGGYWRELTEAVRRGIPNRVGYTHKGFSALVTHPVWIDFPQPYPAYFRDLVSQLAGSSGDWPLRPSIYPQPSDEAKAQASWNEARLGAKPVVACFLTSRQASGVWPARYFAESISHLEKDETFQTVLCGTASDAEILGQLKSEFGLRAITMAGNLDLLSLGCFLRKCAVVLCPDSGPRHIANAVGTPVVFVRNFAVGKIETGAYCETEIDAAPDLERVPSAAQARAFDLLQPAQVAQLVRQQARH